MSKKLIGLLLVVILVSLIAVGDFQIYPSVINIVKNLNGDWTGFSETKVITTTTEKNEQGQIQKTTISEQTHSGKTLWDWLELSSRLAVPILIAVFGYQVQKRDKEKEKELEGKQAEQKAKLEREIAQNNLAEEAIQDYLDNMTKLLLGKEYREELFLTEDNSVKDVARTQTIKILRRLESDGMRQDRIIHFLQDAKLYKFIFKNANLSRINLQGVDLRWANLQGANLWQANLQGTNLWQANLQETNLQEANLQGANLWQANLQEANLQEANLQEANLWCANLQGAKLRKANLQGANLIIANLQGANLSDTNLQKAYLMGTEENLTPKQIKLACFWEEAIYKSKYDFKKKIYVAIEPDNTNYIEELKQNKSSDLRRPPDYSKWEKE